MLRKSPSTVPAAKTGKQAAKHGNRYTPPVEHPHARPVLSVVAPLYNEERGVEELVRRLTASCAALKVSYEIVLVNDGSADGTLQRAIELSKQFPHLRILDLARNFGVMAAYRAGLEHALGEAVVLIDGDLQDPPELIGEFFRAWNDGADVAYGLRKNTHDGWLKRRLASWYYRMMERFSRVKIPANAGTYSLMDRRIVERIKRLPDVHFYFAVQRAWVGGTQVPVLYDRDERKHGKSRVGFRRLIFFGWTALTSVSNAPLRYVSALALIVSFILFLIGTTAVSIRLFTDLATPGWATSTSLIGFVGLVQSFVLAIIAEYVAVIHDEAKKRPLYFLAEEYRKGQPTSPEQSHDGNF